VRPIGRDNWRAVADVAPRDDQCEFVPALAAPYVLLSEYEGVWTSLAVYADDRVVGHVMWAVDEDAYWIGGLVIDAAEQGCGVGRAAMVAMLDRLEAEPAALPVRLSYQPSNHIAAQMYSSLGFVPTGEVDEAEIVAERR
jgi:diamine N-acetyltransferase